MKYLIPAPAVRAGFALFAFAIVVAFRPAPVAAQTGPELLLKPFPKEAQIEATASATIQDSGHAQKSDAEFKLGIYESEGRLRLFPGEEASPRIGYSITYMDMDSAIAGLPRRAIDQSVSFAMPIGKYEDWVFGLSVGVGYAGDSFFGDGDGYYGMGTIGA